MLSSFFPCPSANFQVRGWLGGFTPRIPTKLSVQIMSYFLCSVWLGHLKAFASAPKVGEHACCMLHRVVPRATVIMARRGGWLLEFRYKAEDVWARQLHEWSSESADRRFIARVPLDHALLR